MEKYPSNVCHEIEKKLSFPLFCGVPLGLTLRDILRIIILPRGKKINGNYCLLNKLRMIRYWLYPIHNKKNHLSLSTDKILLTLLNGTPRLTDLVLPILHELKDNNCFVVCGNEDVKPLILKGIDTFTWDQVHSYSANKWRKEYSNCSYKWKDCINAVCRQYELPNGSFDVLRYSLMISSQHVMGCIEFLKLSRPAVIITDYDHNAYWSCLVLAARLLDIPTVGLVHGNMGKDAMAYYPILANKVICWGELGRNKLINAGESPEKVIICGCPKLTREFLVTKEDSRIKLLLDPLKPVVMYGATNEQEDLDYVDSFCRAVDMLNSVSGLVRLHPVSKLSSYKVLIDRHPKVKFIESDFASLDESIASADVVVFHSSAVANDVLVKKCPLVLLDYEDNPSGDGADFVKYAGCPHARTHNELSEIIKKIFIDNSYKYKLIKEAETYVDIFCFAYGEKSAQLTANYIKKYANI